MTTPLTCSICSAPTNYAHLGINACRSCADFYKRTVASKRIYGCRRGDGKCTINKKDSRNCRGCRFNRCKKLGMKWSEEKVSECELVETPALQPKDDILLIRVTKEYLASVERRKSFEMTLRPTSLHRHIKADVEGEDLLLCSWTYMIDCLKMFAGEYIRFASSVFPEYAALSLDDQRLMLRNFATRLYLMEAQCGTHRKFGSHDGPYCMATLTTCHDMRYVEFFTEEVNPSASNTEVVKITNYYTERGKTLIGPILTKYQFTDVEYDFLFALSIWQIDPDQCMPDNIVSLSDICRKQLFEALQLYYQDQLKLSDYSVRLGNLTTFEHVIQEGIGLLNEEVQAYNVAGLLNADAPFLQIVMQIPL